MRIRYFGALALAGAVALAPTAALAADYPVEGPKLVCDATTFVVGQTITCQVTAPNGTVIDFTVNVGGGVLNQTKTLGTTPLTFSFVVPEGVGETITAEVLTEGEVKDTATFTGVPVTTTEVLSAGPVTTASSASLATTGFDGAGMAIGGGVLLAGGIVTVVIATRRTSNRVDA